MTEDTFRQRLLEIAEPFGSRASLAKAAGIPVTSLQGYMNGSEPTRLALVALARAAAVSVHWLATGEGPKVGGIAPEGYREFPCFNLAGIGPYVRGMIGNPTESRLFRLADLPDRVRAMDLVAAVDGCPELSFEPIILSGDLFVFEQSFSSRQAYILDNWKLSDQGDRANDIYLVADGASLKLRKLHRRKTSIFLIGPDNKVERTLDDEAGDFILFGRLIWRSGMLPGASASVIFE